MSLIFYLIICWKEYDICINLCLDKRYNYKNKILFINRKIFFIGRRLLFVYGSLYFI